MKQSILLAALIALAVSACGKKEEAAVVVEVSAPAVEVSVAAPAVEVSAVAATESAPAAGIEVSVSAVPEAK